LDKLPMAELDLIIIENVGNPICPANFDLGEHERISVLSVAEGDDKPVKYPLLFKSAALVLITKCDLLPHTDFDLAGAIDDIHCVNPQAVIIPTNTRTRTGIARLETWMLECIQRRTESVCPTTSRPIEPEAAGSVRL
jgi:hydrogenase nickel incorporation protein HypB